MVADAIVTTGFVARRLELSDVRVRQLADAGKIKAFRTAAGLRLYLAADVEAFAVERERKKAAR